MRLLSSLRFATGLKPTAWPTAGQTDVTYIGVIDCQRWPTWTATSGVRRGLGGTVSRSSSTQFRLRQLHVSDKKEIMGDQHFNFAPDYFFQNGGFSAPNFASSNEFFPTRRRFSDNFQTAQNCLPAPRPRRHATGRCYRGQAHFNWPDVHISNNERQITLFISCKESISMAIHAFRMYF